MVKGTSLTSEISFSREKLLEIPFFSIIKNRFVRKIQALALKARFSRGKVYFTFEIVFYIGNLRKSRFFPLEKTVLLENTSFNDRKRGFLVVKSFLHLK